MDLPIFLADRPVLEAENVLESTRIAVLGAFEENGLLSADGLEYDASDLPLAAEFGELLADWVQSWHQRRGLRLDFRVVRNAFVHAFRCGLDLAVQLSERTGAGLQVDLELAGLAEGTRFHPLRAPLVERGGDLHEVASDVFVSVQDRLLAPAASANNSLLTHDFLACAFLHALLVGVEVGLAELAAAA